MINLFEGVYLLLASVLILLAIGSWCSRHTIERETVRKEFYYIDESGEIVAMQTGPMTVGKFKIVRVK